MKVSIIIPVYNVSDYVERCINSVINQTYTDLECIIVNDCTPDDSIDKCERIIAEYNGPISFIILHHEKNRGLSAARNTGIDIATGEYVYFLDSDDFIIPDCIQLMYNCIINHPKSEIVMGGAKASNGGFEYMDYEKKDYLPEYTDDADWINKAFLTHERLSMTAWNILINKDFIKKYSLFFIEGLINEDEVWHFMLSKYVTHLSILHKNTYFYFIRPNSIVNSTEKIISERNWIKILNIWLAKCGGQYKYREVATIFYHSHIRYIQFNDKILKNGLRQVLIKAIYKASFLQKIGIIIYLCTPRNLIRKKIVIDSLFGLIGNETRKQ